MRRALLAGLLLLARPSLARGGEAKQCSDAYEHGQELKLAHKLDEARAAFLVCAKPACPKVVRDDCARWLGEIEATLPGVIVRLRRSGGPFDDARVLVDGVVMAEHADEHVIAVDPGKHVVRVEPRGCAPHEAPVTIGTGERMPVELEVCQEVPPQKIVQPPPPPPPVARPLPIGPIVVGGVGVAAFASFVVLGAVGLADSNHLRSTCYPRCVNQSAVDSANAELAGADVSLGVAIACFAVAWVWWYVGYTRHRATSATVPLTWRF